MLAKNLTGDLLVSIDTSRKSDLSHIYSPRVTATIINKTESEVLIRSASYIEIYLDSDTQLDMTMYDEKFAAAIKNSMITNFWFPEDINNSIVKIGNTDMWFLVSQLSDPVVNGVHSGPIIRVDGKSTIIVNFTVPDIPKDKSKFKTTIQAIELTIVGENGFPVKRICPFGVNLANGSVILSQPIGRQPFILLPTSGTVICASHEQIN